MIGNAVIRTWQDMGYLNPDRVMVSAYTMGAQVTQEMFSTSRVAVRSAAKAMALLARTRLRAAARRVIDVMSGSLEGGYRRIDAA